MSNHNRKYKKESCRTLLGFLRCLAGQKTQIDLYGGVMAVGTLIDIDVNRNVHLLDVTVSRPLTPMISFKRVCLRYTNVRYVRVPDEIDVMETIRQDIRQMNPKPSDIVGGGQKKKMGRQRDDERNLPPLGPGWSK